MPHSFLRRIIERARLNRHLSSTRRGQYASRRTTKLAFERLEDRRVLSAYTVTNLNDSGTGSLRDAISQATNDGGNDTIEFQAGLTGTIDLSTVGDTTYGPAAFGISTSITIDGNNGSAGIVLERDSGVSNLRFFTVVSSGSLALEGLTLEGGQAKGGNGASGDSFSGGAGGGGGAGLGGAIFAAGQLSVTGTTFESNTAQGGAGGDGTENYNDPYDVGQGSGGGGGMGGDGASGGYEGGGGGGGGTSGDGSEGDDDYGGDGGPGSGGSDGENTLIGAGGRGAGGGGGGAGDDWGDDYFGGQGGDGGVGGGGGGGGALENYSGDGVQAGGGGYGGYGGGGGGGGDLSGWSLYFTVAGSGGDGGFGGGGGGGGSTDYEHGLDNPAGDGGSGGFGAGAGGDGYSDEFMEAYSGGGGGGAGLGGAIFIDAASGSNQYVITNSTFYQNAAVGGDAGDSPYFNVATAGLGYGGGVFARNASVSITNVTFSGNSADAGGGVFVLGDGTAAGVALYNSILNQTLNGDTDFDSTTINSGSVNNSGSNNLVATSGTSTPGALTYVDPQLGTFANHGGPTPTLPITSSSSSAFDAGSDSAADSAGLTVDQRGFLRPAGAHVDIGAVEMESFSTPTLSASDVNSTDSSDSTTTVTATYSNDVDPSTFGTGNITVANGSTTADVTGYSASGDAVTYTIAAPGGTWGNTTAGTYTVTLVAGSVSDMDMYSPVSNEDLGTFVVDNAPPSADLLDPPTVTISGHTVVAVVHYSDNYSGVYPASFSVSNISVDQGATVTGVSASGDDVTYTITAPAATWAASPQGTYTIRFSSASVEDNAGNATTDGATLATFTVDVDPPVITAGAEVSYTERASAVTLDGGLTISSPGEANLVAATVSIASGFVPGDTLSFTNQNGITGSYNATTGVLTLSGNAGLADYQTALESIGFSSTSHDPTLKNAAAARTIDWVVEDSQFSSDAATSTVDVTAVDEAPTISGTIAGQQVLNNASLAPFANVSFADVDSSVIAAQITLGNPAQGTLTNLGAGHYDSTTGVYIVTGSPAAVTSIVDGLVFAPAVGSSGMATFTIVANDGTAHSTDSTTTVNILASNAAPVLSTSGSLSLTDVLVNSNPGTRISTLLASGGRDALSDSDAGAQQGIAVTAIDSAHGTWQYSLNAGSTWSSIGSVSGTSALLLPATALVRFVPSAGWLGLVSDGITFRGWDQTSGAAGTKVSTSNTGGSSAFSTAAATASVFASPFSPAGSTLFVYGTPGSDQFSFDALGGGQFLVSMDGYTKTASYSGYSSIAYQGNGGTDTSVVYGQLGTMNATLSPDTAQVSGSGYSVQISQSPVVYVYGNAASSATLTGAQTFNVLAVTCTYASLGGAGFTEFASGFGSTSSSAGSTSDNAYFYSGSGAQFVSTPSYSYMTAAGTFRSATNYPIVYAYAAAGGGDSAFLYGRLTGSGTLVATPSFTYYAGATAGGSFFDEAVGFASVEAASASTADTAYFFDGAGTNHFVASAGAAAMAGSGYVNVAQGFSAIFAFATQGTDQATVDLQSRSSQLSSEGSTEVLTTTGGSVAMTGFAQVSGVGLSSPQLDAIDFVLENVASW